MHVNMLYLFVVMELGNVLNILLYIWPRHREWKGDPNHFWEHITLSKNPEKQKRDMTAAGLKYSNFYSSTKGHIYGHKRVKRCTTRKSHSDWDMVSNPRNNPALVPNASETPLTTTSDTKPMWRGSKIRDSPSSLSPKRQFRSRLESGELLQYNDLPAMMTEMPYPESSFTLYNSITYVWPL